MYLVHPLVFSASAKWLRHMSFKGVLSQRTLLEVKGPITFFKYSKVSSSFIQPFVDDATSQQFLKFSFNAAASLIAPWNLKMISSSFLPLFPDPFLKSQNWSYLWIKSLKLYTVCFLLHAKLRAIKIYWN